MAQAPMSQPPMNDPDGIVDFPEAGEDAFLSLSDEELENILDSAEITDTPLADIDIDLEEPSVAAVAAPPAVAVPAPVTPPPAAVEPEPASGGFFPIEEDETIALSTDELDTILDESAAGSGAAFSASGSDGNLLLEEELPLIGEIEPAAGDDGAGSDRFLDSEDLQVEESLVSFDEDDLLLIEEPAVDSFEIELSAVDAPEPVSPEPLAPEPLAPVSRAAEPAPEDAPVVAVSGDAIDELVGEIPDAVDEPLADFTVAGEVGGLEDSLLAPEPVFDREAGTAVDSVEILEDAVGPDGEIGQYDEMIEIEEAIIDDSFLGETLPPASEPVPAEEIIDLDVALDDDMHGDLLEAPIEIPAPAVPVVEAAVITDDEPVAVMDEELVFAEDEMIQPPAPSVAPPPAAFPPPPEEVTAVATDGDTVQGLPEKTLKDVRKVLGYLDGLFDELPEERVKEFANSEYYELYNKLFRELGI